MSGRLRAAPHLAAAAAALLLLGGCDGSPPRRVEHPNVVLITIDTLRADALGAYGQERPTSPFLDRLAGEGVLFEQCSSPVPHTLPSHATILTGKQPYAHGVRSNSGYVLGAAERTLAEVLGSHGYRTAAEVAAGVIGRRTFIDQGFEQFRDPDSPDVEWAKVTTFRPGEAGIGAGEVHRRPERMAEDVTRGGIQVMEELAGEPFLLWLHYFDPHTPYQPPPPHRQQIPDSTYHAEVRYVDAQIQRFVQALEARGLAERTLVVVTADHGESLGEHGEKTHSFFVYEATARVPLIFWGPGLVPEGRRIEAPVRVADIAPTVLDLLGLPPLEGVQGRSLLPLIDGEAEDLGLVGYGESIQPMLLFDASVLRFVREGEWKYIHKPVPELYHLPSDPHERENLAEREPEKLAELRARLRELIEAAPPAPTTGAALDPATRAELEALGYVASAPPGADRDLATLELSGPDPGALVDDMAEFVEALARRRPERAAYALRSLHDRYPRSTPILASLAEPLLALGRTEELEELLVAGIALREPGQANVLRMQLARARLAAGDPEGAAAALREALALDPCDLVLRDLLARQLHERGRHAEQIRALEEGVAACPAAPSLARDLAYALATTPDDALRDGPRALELTRPIQMRSFRDAEDWHTLAAAHAAVGDLPAARQHLERALDLLGSRRGAAPLAEKLRAQQEALEAGRPLRD